MKRSRAFSLIELLVCVAIIAILSAISVNAYQGSLDQADLKYAAPALVGKLNALRQDAAEKGLTTVVTFQLGSTSYEVSSRKGSEVTSETVDMMSHGIIRRKLRFLRYEWPDGARTPTTFTFAGSASIQGGILYFGTGNAEAAIRVEGNRVWTDVGV